MGSLKVYSLWFPRERLPTLNSLQFMIGVLGAWSSTKPIELLLRVLDWRELYLLFAAITVLAALFMVPLAAAWIVYFMAPGLGPQAGTNRGELLTTPVVMEAASMNVPVVHIGGAVRPVQDSEIQ